MKIIFNYGGQDYYLVDGSTRMGVDKHIGPEKVDHDSSSIVDTSPILRATTIKPLPRGNTLTLLTFPAEVEKSNVAAAMAYALDYPRLVPRNARGTLRCVETVNNADTVRTLANAVMRRIRCHADGVRVFINYEIVGSEFS